MKFKVVPEPGTPAAVERARGALPLVPKPEGDCVARLMDELALTSREEARGWLTFLRALGLAAEGPAGFRRVRADPDDLGERFVAGVYGAGDVLALLRGAEGPLPAGAVFDRFAVPTWERDRHTDPDAVWGERVERILGWLVAFGLAERADGGFRAE